MVFVNSILNLIDVFKISIKLNLNDKYSINVDLKNIIYVSIFESIIVLGTAESVPNFFRGYVVYNFVSGYLFFTLFKTI